MDASNPVVALCAAGVHAEGTPEEARRLFAEAWAMRRDDYDACIAAHFVARHQPTPADTLHWNALAVLHAERVVDGRADAFFASLYLNLADSYAAVGRLAEAGEAARLATDRLAAVPDGGYRELVARGIGALQTRLADPSA